MSHPDLNLTLREAFEKYYADDAAMLSPRTREKYIWALNRWELFTDDPPVGEITNRTLAAFRDALLQEAGLAPVSVKGAIQHLRPILNRLGPPGYRNHAGEAILDRVPWCKLPRVPRTMPRIASPAELDRLYHACDSAVAPQYGVPAADFWRCLLVFLYNVGSRREDTFGLPPSAVSFEERLLTFRAHKTGKLHTVPLNEITLLHLRSIWADGRRAEIFPVATWRRRGIYKQWKALQQVAGINPPLPLHHLRKTCGSRLAAVGFDVAKHVLGHAPQGVTEVFYLNPTDRIREAVDRLPQPESFQSIRDRVPADALPALNGEKSDRTSWTFTQDAAIYRGRRIPIADKPRAVLQTIIAAGGAVSGEDLARCVWWNVRISRTTVKTTIAQVRQILRRELELPPGWNPLPNSGDGSGWTLTLPEES